MLLYIAVILLMTWLAYTRLLQASGQTAGQVAQGGALPACIGAVLFVISDAVLALNRFRGSFRAAPLLNLSTYFAAQALIAGSLGLLM